MATVDELKQELRQLSLSKDINSSTPISNRMQIPDDIIKQTLLYSDLNTIINTCTSNKYTIKICDNQFWIDKLTYEHFPILIKYNSFNEWLKYYKLILDVKREAEMMVKIVITYNQFKGIPSILILAPNYIIQFYYNKDTNSWIYIDTSNKNKKKEPILYDNVIHLLTNKLIEHKIGDNSYDFFDYTDEQNIDIYYENLQKKLKMKKISPIVKMYAVMYQLLMNK